MPGRGQGSRALVAALALVVVCTVVVWQTGSGDAAQASQKGDVEIRQGDPVVPSEFRGDLRRLPRIPSTVDLLPELEPLPATFSKYGPSSPPTPRVGTRSMPNPAQSFDGLDHDTWGAGWPPDTVGDVGPTYFVQAVNTSVGIFAKTGGAPVAAFTFNTMWTGAGTGTACDTTHRGDPTVVYDPQADRFIVADFAWGSGTALQDGPYYECIAVSKTSDPVNGGWWLYAVRGDDAGHPWLPDYPKMGIWPDGLYMTANMFDCTNADCSTANYSGVRAWAFNRADLESGATLRSVVADISNLNDFSLVPSNLRGAAPPAGRPNLLVSESSTAFAWEVWKFHVDWTTPGNSTFTGPTLVPQTSYTVASATVPSSANALDSLYERVMMQNQYRNLGGTESIWVNHTVRTGPNPAPNGIQWAQINVTGGTVNTTAVQQQIYGNVGSDGVYRWMGALAVDKQGNMAIGYSASKAAMNPEIRYSGRLVSDTLGTLAQGEGTIVAGGGSQNYSSRWGDYSAMTVDPVDDCTFWFTTEYYATTGSNWKTRIASFKFPSCTSAADTTIDSHPTNPTNSTSATFTFSGGATFECSLDGAASAACTSPQVYTGLAKRSHLFSVAATGDATPATFAWTNGKPPKVTFSPKPPKVTNSTTFSFTSSDPGGTLECSIDAAPFEACTSPKAYPALGEGPHTFAVRGIDAANRAGKPATASWTVDLTPPTTTIAKGPANPTTATSAKFSLVADEKKSTFECNLDGAGFTPCKKSPSYTSLGTGPHTFSARATDAAGNTGGSAGWAWTITP